MQQSQIILTPETADDWWEIEALYDLSFAPGRTALSSYRLREGVPAMPDLSFAARDTAGILAGAIRCWRVQVGTDKAVLLGPIAVHPTRQGEGVAALLMHECIAAARAAGWLRIVLVGDFPYYKRYGFAQLRGVVMPPPTNPDRILGLALVPGAWDQIRGEARRPAD